jgi:hypothetical protein
MKMNNQHVKRKKGLGIFASIVIWNVILKYLKMVAKANKMLGTKKHASKWTSQNFISGDM